MTHDACTMDTFSYRDDDNTKTWMERTRNLFYNNCLEQNRLKNIFNFRIRKANLIRNSINELKLIDFDEAGMRVTK